MPDPLQDSAGVAARACDQLQHSTRRYAHALRVDLIAPRAVSLCCAVRNAAQVSKERKSRTLNTREGYLDVLYFDEQGLRVSRSADNGLLYLHLREGAALV